MVNKVFKTLRRVLGIGLAWAIVWLAFWTIVGGIIAVFDPDSIDSGEGPMLIFAILGPMGLLTGVVFGILLSIGSRGRSIIDAPLSRVAAWGIAGTAIVQLGYLGHGDAGVLANIKMALLFSAFGGVVTMAWLVMARGGRMGRRRCSQPPDVLGESEQGGRRW